MNETTTQVPQFPSGADVAAKLGAELSAIQAGHPTPPYDGDWLKRQQESEERQEVQLNRRTRMDIFAEILRARSEVSAESAAEQAVKVYELLK